MAGTPVGPHALGRDLIRPVPGHGETADSIDSATLRIGSYNVHQCVGTDLRRDPARIAQVIRELECDTVALQEVDSRPGARAESMQLDYLATALGMQAIPGPTISRHGRDYGNALLTRRQVLAVRRHDFSCAGCEPRGAVDVELAVAGVAVRIVATHLGLGAAERRRQVNGLLDVLQSVPAEQPLILLGDINEWLPFGRPLRWLHRRFGTVTGQRTFPVWLPMFALDRIWVSPREALREFRVHRSGTARVASDHYPVKARVDILPARARETVRTSAEG